MMVIIENQTLNLDRVEVIEITGSRLVVFSFASRKVTFTDGAVVEAVRWLLSGGGWEAIATLRSPVELVSMYKNVRAAEEGKHVRNRTASKAG